MCRQAAFNCVVARAALLPLEVKAAMAILEVNLVPIGSDACSHHADLHLLSNDGFRLEISVGVIPTQEKDPHSSAHLAVLLGGI